MFLQRKLTKDQAIINKSDYYLIKHSNSDSIITTLDRIQHLHLENMAGLVTFSEPVVVFYAKELSG